MPTNRKPWSAADLIKLEKLAQIMTTAELEKEFPTRTHKAIERAVEKLRDTGKIKYRDPKVIDRAYSQRQTGK